MNSVYRECLKYARRCAGPFYCEDIINDAWIANFKRNGTNLFEEPLLYAIRCVKFVWLNEQRSRKFMKDGELHTYFFRDTENLQLASSFRPEAEIITKEFYEGLFREIDNYRGNTYNSVKPDKLRQLLKLLDEGWTIREISNMTGVSFQTLNNHKLKLREIISKMDNVNNPFAGSKIKVKKKISRKLYEEKYKSEYKYDPDQDCDYNESYMLVTNGEDYLLVREKE